MFQTLFHEDERGAVAPVVRELWGARGLAAVETPAAVAPAEPARRAASPAARALTRRSICSASCGRRAAPRLIRRALPALRIHQQFQTVMVNALLSHMAYKWRNVGLCRAACLSVR